jgi:signal transduction histidine kinase
MRPQWTDRAPVLVPALAVAAVVFTGVVLSIATQSHVLPVDERGLAATSYGWLAVAAISAGTGALILVHNRRHLVGWSLVGYGGGSAISFALFAIVILLADADRLTAAIVIEGLSSAVLTASFMAIPAAVFLFPTGAVPSARWRPLGWLFVAAMVTGFFAAFVNTGFGGDRSDQLFGPGPLQASLGSAASAMAGLYFLLMAICGIGAVVSLVSRFRHSVGEERLQLKWVVAAGMFFAFTLILTIAVTGGAKIADGSVEVIMSLGLMSIPVSMGIAILKYRLYDIDVVISRSLTYAALAVFIGVVYIGIVVGIGELLDDGDRASFGLSILATAVVAMAFQPVRVRVERLANRLVYGERATPYEVLARFSQRAAEMSDEDLLKRIPRLIVDGTGASDAALWVRSDGGFRIATSWPDATIDRSMEATDTFTDPDADYSLPVFHDDELLGGITLVKERGEPITPAEEELLADLADGMGLALRNTLLTSELREQVKDLKRSRDRVVTAADEARRSLERDLDSGPQQQLVAVKVKLGPARVLAGRAGAEKTEQILADIEAQAGDAIRAIRDFAGGIYPPLLGAEGLAIALGQQTQKAAIPVSLLAESIDRYPRDVEAAVYFTVLEALQNTAKYAQATSAEVRLSEENGDLRFVVTDDGTGFDMGQVTNGAGLSGISDRMDTVGGSWNVASIRGSGTTITGKVPVRDPARL